MTEKTKTETKTEKKETKPEEREKRGIVVPGELVAKGFEYLPGEGTKREGSEVVAIKYGLLDKNERFVKIIPLSGAYIPRIGNTVIGRITDLSFNGWFVDILSAQSSFLPLSECSGRINRNDLAEVYDIGDMIVSKVKSIKSRTIDVSMRDRGLHKLIGGLIIKVNASRVPRIIGRSGSMVKTIKDETLCNIIIGQNGLIWIKGMNVDDELLAKEAIEFIAKKPFIEGLTDKIKDFLEKRKKELKKSEKKELKTEKTEKKETKEEKK
jgi:exosome complex component RRP4